MRKLSLLFEFDTMLPAHDARTGHGYGRIGKPNGLGTVYQQGAVYPYGSSMEDVQDEDEDIDDDPLSDMSTLRKFIKQTGIYYQSANVFNASRPRVDRRSFANSAVTGLSEDRKAHKGLVPFVGLYRGKDTSTGGMAPTVYKTRPGAKGGVGSKKGYSMAPPTMLSKIEEPTYTKEELPDREDLDMKQIKKDYDDFVHGFKTQFDE